MAQGITILERTAPPIWLALEDACLTQGTVEEALWANFNRRPKNLDMLPPTNLLIRIWSQAVLKLGVNSDLMYAAPLQTLTLHTTDMCLDTWIRHGISYVNTLFGNAAIVPFPVLQQTFTLPSRELFTYLRIKNILHEQKLHTGRISPMSRFALKCQGKLKGIKALSFCYTSLMHLGDKELPPYMRLWEKDLNIKIHQNTWQLALERVKKPHTVWPIEKRSVN
ncbi:Hypothetical predicted protein [Pelobates cultripes]|uniref:Reverse transcriptase n=1 Tax=Pelobates cultripes TaxID=61616 RepID=A0AAD1W6L6_PELCU|nr:Hypothetical predicted protein [Pelobates cultripes]